MVEPTEVAFVRLLLIGIGLMVVAGGALVIFLVTYQQRLLQQQLQQQLLLRATEAAHERQVMMSFVEAQEEERERIGQDLHDGIGATLATIKLLISRLARLPTSENPTELFTLVETLANSAVQDVRGIAHSLYPAVLTRYGLAEALQHLVKVSQEAGALAIELDLTYPRPLALAQELALYRICQELTHNALKHAKGATRLAIVLRQDISQLRLSVEDDGCGFPSAHAASPAAMYGAGLRSIEVRVQLLGGHLHQQSSPGHGVRTVVELKIPR